MSQATKASHKEMRHMGEISFGSKRTSLDIDILLEIVMKSWACQVALVVENLPANARDSWLDPWVRNIPWGGHETTEAT